MKILYVFPHPDDESFGFGQVLHHQVRQGHEVHLLTLTRGGATRQRHRYGHSVEQMGEVRAREMEGVREALKLTGMTITDLPDSGLKELPPAEIEAVIREEILRLEPEVVVTYPVHGISGFHDHLVSHAVVKSVFCDLRGKPGAPRRLAFATVTEETAGKSPHFPLSASKDDEIDCLVRTDPEDLEACQRALDCYVTFQETIEASGIRDLLATEVPFELYREEFSEKIGDLFADLPQ